ncbi:MAG: hypothetical protein HFE81_06300 [Bacilli bacterium]|nr:hypothetical protein [Bacilli bacterium]
MTQVLTEDEKIMNAIHENYKKNNKTYLKKLQNSKLTLLDVILVNVGMNTFFIGFMYLISVIENLRF